MSNPIDRRSFPSIGWRKMMEWYSGRLPRGTLVGSFDFEIDCPHDGIHIPLEMRCEKPMPSSAG
jgi:hypothetical protein